MIQNNSFNRFIITDKGLELFKELKKDPDIKNQLSDTIRNR
jgi:hypothetical protein